MTTQIDRRTWLAELFKFEYCAECHGDVQDHDAVPDVFGNWFAMCKPDAVCHVEDCDWHQPARG